jgi:hypothetical protein
VGDVLPDCPGLEIVAVGADGSVYVVWQEEGDWKSVVAFRAPGEVVQCAVGDLDPDRPGDEIVAVGMRQGEETRRDGGGAAYVVCREGNSWKGEKVLEDVRLLHAACIRRGEAFVAGYGQKVFRLRPSSEGWKTEAVADLPGAGKGAVVTPRGVVMTCTDGSLVRLDESRDGFAVEVIDHREGAEGGRTGRARVGAAGDRIIVSDNDGTLSIVGPGGATVIHREPDMARGAVLADLDPAHPGLEAATAGYAKNVTIFYPTAGGFRPRIVYRDSMKLHHLQGADLDGKPGIELVTCGYSGLLVVIRPSLLGPDPDSQGS